MTSKKRELEVICPKASNIRIKKLIEREKELLSNIVRKYVEGY